MEPVVHPLMYVAGAKDDGAGFPLQPVSRETKLQFEQALNAPTAAPASSPEAMPVPSPEAIPVLGFADPASAPANGASGTQEHSIVGVLQDLSENWNTANEQPVAESLQEAISNPDSFTDRMIGRLDSHHLAYLKIHLASTVGGGLQSGIQTVIHRGGGQ